MRTTYVLGAGASYPYGFPLGISLVEKIIAEAKNKSRGSVNGFKRFADDLRHSAAESIDAYLASRLEYVGELRYGKQLIAEIILSHENEALLYQSDEKSRPWYRRFFNQLEFLKDDFNDCKPLNIITFNYDRSLEYFLFHFIKARLRLKMNEEAFRLLHRKFNIVHVYGRLPALPGEAGTHPDFHPNDLAIDYGNHSADHQDFLEKYAEERLMTIHEAKAERPVVEKIRDIYKSTDRLIFMGMSYHELNMKLLQFPLESSRSRPQFPIKKAVGTALGLGKISRDRVSERYGITLHACDCATLFDEHVDLIEYIVDNHGNGGFGSSSTGSPNSWMR